MWWILLLVPWCSLSFVKSDDFDDDDGEPLPNGVVHSRRISTSYYDDTLPQSQLIARTLDLDDDLKSKNLVTVFLPKAYKATKTPQRESLLQYQNNVVILGPIDLSTDNVMKLKENGIRWALREDKKRSKKSKINTLLLENLPEERFSLIDPRSVFAGKLVDERECSNGMRFIRSTGLLGGTMDCKMETTCYCVFTTRYFCTNGRVCKKRPDPIDYPDSDRSTSNPRIIPDSSEVKFQMPPLWPTAWPKGPTEKPSRSLADHFTDTDWSLKPQPVGKFVDGVCFSPGQTFVMDDPCRACVCLTNTRESMCVIKDQAECEDPPQKEGVSKVRPVFLKGKKRLKASKSDDQELSESLDELINLKWNYNPTRSDNERNEEPLMLRNEDGQPSNIYLLFEKMKK